MYDRWGLSQEMSAWGFSKPTPQALYEALGIDDRSIPWERLTGFQNVTIRLICERLVGITNTRYHSEPPLPRIKPPQHDLAFHAYCSCFNAPALGVVQELATLLEGIVCLNEYVLESPGRQRRLFSASSSGSSRTSAETSNLTQERSGSRKSRGNPPTCCSSSTLRIEQRSAGDSGSSSPPSTPRPIGCSLSI